MSRTSSFVVSVCASFVLAGAVDAGTVRVGNWNVANHPNDAADVANLATVASDTAARPLDVLAMVETDLGSSSNPINSAAAVASALGSAYGAGFSYVTAAADGGGDRTGFAYNTGSLQLLSTATVTGITHPSLRALFRPVGTTGDADFYYYAVHLQSGSTATIRGRRAAQAQVLRADADGLGSANVIFGGDLNWQGADEITGGGSAFRLFNAAGNGQVFDPINQVGAWNGNAAFKPWHTNAPATNMDDRFDMQLISSELTDGVGLDYVAGTYNVLGNNGTHTLKAAITTGTGAPADVLGALAAFSDHLPVMADYAFVPEPGVGLVIAVAALVVRRRRHR